MIESTDSSPGMPGYPESGRVIRLVLIVGVRLYREGLAVELRRNPKVTVVGQTGAVAEALTIIARASPDVVLVDIRTAGAMTLVRSLRDHAPDVPVVALAVDENEDDIERCAEAGMVGFVTQEVTVDGIAEAVIAACRGELNCSPRSAALLLHRLSTLVASGRPGSVLSQLTGREREILVLLAAGRSNKMIAADLNIETTTVKNHVHRILQKTGARSRVEAAARHRTTELSSFVG